MRTETLWNQSQASGFLINGTARPVLFVADLQGAIRFYVDKLGFEKRWHAGDGKGIVCQVNRGGCEIILCEDTARQNKGRLFVELNRDGIDELRREIWNGRCRLRKRGGATT
jgi:catechol 2,3-dioxygenase-like lactoylglutathione lyase family enzyme